MAEAKKLLLIDGMAVVYRAHYVFENNPRRTSGGLNTSCIYGFMNTWLEVVEKEKPSHRAVAFDTSAPTFRHERYADYKAHREAQPEDISMALPWIDRLLAALEVPVFRLDGYEADDLIGTFSRKASAEGFEVVILTPDKDFGQLIDREVVLYKPSRGRQPAQRIGLSGLSEAYGVARPEQVIDLLALQGDAVDNIPGVPGIGKKTAQRLLAEHGSVETLLAHMEALPAKVAEKLRAHRKELLLSRELATIDCDVPMALDLDSCAARPMQREVMRELLATLEFRKLSERLLGEKIGHPMATANLFEQTPTTAAASAEKPSRKQGTQETQHAEALRPLPEPYSGATPQYHLLEQSKDIKALLKYLGKQQKIALRLVVEHERPAAPTIVAVGLSYFSEEGFAVVLPKDRKACKERLALLGDFFANNNRQLICLQAKDCLLALQGYDLELSGPFFDLSLAHYLHDPEASHSLLSLVNHYLPTEAWPVLGEEAPPGLIAAQEAAQSLALAPKIEPLLSVGRLRALYESLEHPLIGVLARMETAGVCVEQEALAALAVRYRTASAALEQEIQTLAGQPFKVTSPKQLGEVLFEQLALEKKPKKTKTGAYATNEAVLQPLAAKHPIVAKILDYREYQKLCNTYLEVLPRYISASDGRIHTNYRQDVAATGRLSANHPNLQNIPIRTEKGKSIRKAFVAKKEHMLVTADYSQVELRILASMAKDEVMLASYARNEDIHRATAAQVFNCNPASVTDEQRRVAKTANFGILYGISAYGLAGQLHMGRSEAQTLIDTYFKTFPRIQNFIEEQQAQARAKGFVETHWGRRRYLPGIQSRNASMRAFAERNAINAPIQGTAADIIKRAMCVVDEWLRKQQLATQLILQIHDELLFEAPYAEVDSLRKNLPTLMEGVSDLEVPLLVSIGAAENWLDAHH